MRSLVGVFAGLMLVMSAALAEDIVTMPTANQLKKGELDVAAYYLALDTPPGAPEHVYYLTLYAGVTDHLEIDLHWSDVDKDKSSLVVVASYKLLSENPNRPDVVVGIRNLFMQETTNNPDLKDKSDDPSVYIAGAKTFFFKPEKPGPPLVRAHLGFGSADWTLLGEERHQGAFGGLQFLFHPTFGAVVEHDGTDWITALTYMPPKTGLTIKGGTYGQHLWIGLAYRRDLF